MYTLLFSDPPAQFSSGNLGLPKITYVKLPDDNVGTDVKAASVILLCKVAILNGIEKWRNVSYLIEWVAEGTTLKNETMCEVKPGQTNKYPCPGHRRDLISRLPSEKYTVGQSVRIKNLTKLVSPRK